MIRRPPRSTHCISSAASDVYKRQVKLLGTDENAIVAEASTLLTDSAAYDAMANAVNPYGDGDAVPRVLAAMAALAGEGERLPDFQP